LVNWQRLSSYGNNGNAVLIDAYLQGVKQRAGKKGWKFRDWIAEETLINQCVKPRHSWRGYKHTGVAC